MREVVNSRSIRRSIEERILMCGSERPKALHIVSGNVSYESKRQVTEIRAVPCRGDVNARLNSA